MNATPPLTPAPTTCRTDAAIVGRWFNRGLSQLGPAATSMTFKCDCVMSTETWLLWGRIKGNQRYHVESGTIVIEGSNSTSRVQFTRKDDQLELSWPAGEKQRLTLKKPLRCPATDGG